MRLLASGLTSRRLCHMCQLRKRHTRCQDTSPPAAARVHSAIRIASFVCFHADVGQLRSSDTMERNCHQGQHAWCCGSWCWTWSSCLCCYELVELEAQAVLRQCCGGNRGRVGCTPPQGSRADSVVNRRLRPRHTRHRPSRATGFFPAIRRHAVAGWPVLHRAGPITALSSSQRVMY